MIRSLVLLGLAAATPAAAAAFQDTVSLDRAVAGFTGRQIGDDGGARAAIDARLKLKPCPTVALSWRSDAHDAVVVTCAFPDWRVFVPVRMTGSQPAISSGAIAKADPVIRRGDAVLVEAGSSGFAISREGVAMSDAAPGGRVQIKVDGDRAPVQAVAVATGRATLPGWTQ